MAGPLTLHIGCGPHYLAGAINVDLSADVADLRARAADLPLADESVDRVLAVQLLEHLPHQEALAMLGECWRVLRQGGRLVLETPDPEASFRRFLEQPEQEQRAPLLSWIFGLDDPGQAHRLLWPWELLEPTLRRAGFEAVRRGEPRFHLGTPALRVTARKAGGEVFGKLARLRSRLRHDPEVDLTRQASLLEFEQRFMDGLAAPEQDAPLLPALTRVALSPAAAAHWADLGLATAVDPARLGRICRAALEVDLAGRLDALFLDHDAPPPGRPGADAHTHALARAVEALLRAWEAPGRAASLLEQRLPAPRRDPGLPAAEPFLRARAAAFVAARVSRAVRHLANGRDSDARPLLEQAARTGHDPLYAWWNLAVLHNRTSQPEQAAQAYARALACPGAAEARGLAREARALGDTAARPRLAPVLWGEGIHHDPR